MNWDDLLFRLVNSIFNFIFWIILDKERFWTFWVIYCIIITIFCLFIIKKEINDKGSG